MKLLELLFLVTIVATAKAAPSSEGRIIGGEKAKLGEFPYIVSLQVYGQHGCGGSILSEKFVLTATHCVTHGRPDLVQIQYGVVNLQSEENKVQVIAIHMKENYSPWEGYLNDMAILELEEEIKFGPNVQPVKLPSAVSHFEDFSNATLVGWGRTYDGSSVSQDLLKVNIILFSHDFCKARESWYNPDHHVCAGVPEGGRGQCGGDSGGPLTVDGVQYGVVSWSIKPCASLGNPGIFANVAAYRDWITKISGV